jgi:hypothetical protein
MKKLISFAIVAIVLASCGNSKQIGCDAYSSTGIIIKPTGDNEGRPYYSVYMSDGTIHEYMYAEEIARGLTENNWTPDEDLILAYANQE